MNPAPRAIRRSAVLALAMAGLAATASGYYHFLHYATAAGSYTPIPEKFDLAALHNNTLYYFVSDSGPAKLAPGDSFAALLSQIRLAGQTWNGVRTSDLRLAYGGLFPAGATQSTPRMEVVFEELPPGLLGMGGPTARADIASGPNGSFVPILRSTVVLTPDFSALPSYASSPNDTLLTVIHEMGHALGLQHTLTSSAMSTEVTRATTKALPLAADDIAGLSLLYPNAAFAAQFGSLSGRVTMSGSGVHLASVVAINPSGPAVSALTNPDGTYRIDGLLPSEYYVYVHPLPPSVQSDLGPTEIVLPLNSDGRSIPASDPFGTQFYPGTQDQKQALRVRVASGATASGIDFSVDRRAAPRIYGITTYSFPVWNAVHPAFEDFDIPSRWLVASGSGLLSNGAVMPGLGVSVLGDAATVPPKGVYPYYLDPYDYLQVNLLFTPFSGEGPRHLVFSAGDEVCVLPSGITLVSQSPPSVTSVTPGVDSTGSRIVTISGKALTATTRILFDGLLAAVDSFDELAGEMVVTPPPGASNYRANVVALNADGQTSLFGQDPPTYTYDPSAAPSISLSPNSLPAGAEAMIEVTGVNTNFTDGETWLGLGSSDVWVKRLWVLSPTQLRAEVVVSAAAPAGNTLVSATSGFQVISQPAAFQILPGNPQAVVASSDLVNAVTQEPWVYPGAMAKLSVSNLPADANPTVTLNGVAASVVALGEKQITFQVPASLSPGQAVLQLQVGASASYPIVVWIDPPPPVVTAVLDSGVPLDSSLAARAGDLLTIQVSGLADAGATVAESRLHVSVGGIDQTLGGPALPAPDAPGQHQILILLSELVPAGPQPLTVSIDYRTSAPYTIAVQGQ
ncbi:MAG: matrixin family metalloprotease [Bryobacteraceae bacterium]